jgi:hypothetical protein
MIVSTLGSVASAEIRLGATGGLARYGFSGDKPDESAYKTQTRAAFGGVFELDVHKGIRLSIQPSLIQKGTGIAYEVEGQKERVDSVQVDTGYLSIPILVKIFTPSERWFVSSGLEFAWLMDAEYMTSSEDTDITDDLDEFDMVIHFGLGWIKPFGPHEFLIEVRYTQGIMNLISDSNPEGEFYGSRVKNKGLLLLAGFLFQL